jgi:ubiquinol-cytochrome c reductase cytochrome b subunit
LRWSRIKEWVDERTGWVSLWRRWKARPLEGKPSWLKATGFCLAALILWQALTGILLMLVYTPSTTDAWASIYYIENEVQGGRLIRGIHYYGAHAVIILTALHLGRVLVSGAYRRPYELLWVTGICLAAVVLLWAMTGNPLSWSQKARDQGQVEVQIVGSIPALGPVLKRILLRGTDLGQRALTQLYTLHVAILPAVAFLLFLALYSQLYHLASHAEEATLAGSSTPYVPGQSFRNLVFLAVVICVILFLAYAIGAPLHPPADPLLPSSPRPEWYFLALYELRSFFGPKLEIVATLVIPLAIVLLLLALPAIDRRLSDRGARMLRWSVALGGAGFWAALTVKALVEDYHDPTRQAVLSQWKELTQRAVQLAAQGIPVGGPAELLRRDPLTRGPQLFQDHCAPCHPYGGQWSPQPRAADLKGFATESWIWALVQNPAHENFFGRTKRRTMARWSQETLPTLDKQELEEIHLAARWLAGRPQGLPAPDDTSEFARGYEAFETWCLECHRYEGQGGTHMRGPDLTKYGSVDWIKKVIRNARQEDLYGSAAEMPPFEGVLTDLEIELLARWLAGEHQPVLP